LARVLLILSFFVDLSIIWFSIVKIISKSYSCMAL
jgi:hypothetical protein